MKINADVALLVIMLAVILILWMVGKVSDARNRVRHMTDLEYRDEMFERNQSAREEAESKSNG